jgi:3',5'-cyclic AMP phosphodiesterase CpdA
MHFELFSRRDFLRAMPALAAATALADDAPPAPATAPAAPGFRFIAINDLHYLAADCGRWFRAVVEQMKTEAAGAAFCLLCGDLADRGDRESLTAVKEIFSTLGVPLHPVPGNHDYKPGNSREDYDAVYPGCLNYRFIHEGWQFVGLDTTQGTDYDKTSIPASTLAWLDAEPLDKEKPTLVFTHFPLGEGVTYRPLNAAAVLERLMKLNLVAALSGHWHGASERNVPHGEKQAVLTTSRCCSRVRNNADKSPLKGWWVCDARADGSLARRFVEFHPPEGIPTEDVAGKKAPAKAVPAPAPKPVEPPKSDDSKPQ